MQTKAKQRPRIGDRRWRVEWCSDLAFYENSEDIDRDRCTISAKSFAEGEEQAAIAFAESVWPKAQFAIVELDLMEFRPYDDADAATMPHVGFWECVQDSRILSGEWEA